MPQPSPQPSQETRTSLLLPLALGAMAITLAVTSCDRPGTRAVAPEPRTYASNEATTARRPAEFDNTSGGATSSPSYPSRDALSDTVISGKIKAAILTDPGMTGADVSVNTDNGVVSLTGSVKSQEQTAIASAHAQGQDGVMRVDNHLSLTPQ